MYINLTKNRSHDKCNCEIQHCWWDPYHHSMLYCLDHDKHVQWLKPYTADQLEQLGIPRNTKPEIPVKWRKRWQGRLRPVLKEQSK